MRRGLKLAVLLAVVVVGLVAFAGWWYFVRDDDPPEAALPDREPATTQPAADGDDGDGTGSGDGGTGAAGLEGTWTVALAEETFAGFRIEEQFTGGLDHTAVVRTPAVEGRLVVAGTAITEVEVTADLTRMESVDDQPPGVPGVGNRVGQMRDDGLETNRFPTATFVLTQPIELGSLPAVDEVVTADAVGELTLHGVTREITVPVEARWNGSLVDVAGSAEVVLADFDMEPPTRQFVTAADRGTMELQLVFEPAG